MEGAARTPASRWITNAKRESVQMSFGGREFRKIDKCPQLIRGTTGGSDNTVKEEASDPDASMARRIGSMLPRGSR
jgi:hypothetical protein